MRLSRLTLLVLGGAFLALALGGCAAPRVHLSVNGYANPAYTSGPAGSSLAVLRNLEAENPLLDAEVARKLERAISASGYRIVGPDQAGFLVTYSFGLDQGPAVTRYAPNYEPGETYTTFGGYDRRGRAVYHTYHRPAYTYYQPYQEQLQRRWLQVRIIDAGLWRKERKEVVIWAGDAESFGASRDLRSILNFLIAGAIRQLWVDTGRALETRIPVDDPVVDRIRKY